jgi:spore germination cell wall hydrolase CwlJ-like protein
MILASALLCLSLNVYNEARGEPILGQYAVAAVTMNRAGDDPAKVCEVVTAPHQFSWTTSKLARDRQGWRLKAAGVPKDDFAWMVASKIAYNTLTGKKIDLTHGATFYHATRVKPAWRHHVERAISIGNHIFYRYI